MINDEINKVILVEKDSAPTRCNRAVNVIKLSPLKYN